MICCHVIELCNKVILSGGSSRRPPFSRSARHAVTVKATSLCLDLLTGPWSVMSGKNLRIRRFFILVFISSIASLLELVAVRAPYEDTHDGPSDRSHGGGGTP
jgi:hypothetical protein